MERHTLGLTLTMEEAQGLLSILKYMKSVHGSYMHDSELDLICRIEQLNKEDIIE